MSKIILFLGLLLSHPLANASVAAGHYFMCKTISFDLKNARLNCDADHPNVYLTTPREWIDEQYKNLKVNGLVSLTLDDKQYARWQELNRDLDKKTSKREN